MKITSMQVHRKSIALAALVLSIAFALGSKTADAVTINFDTFPDNASVPNGTFISAQYEAAFHVAFSSSAPGGFPTAGSFAGEASSSPNVLQGVNPGRSGGLFPIFIDFTGS